MSTTIDTLAIKSMIASALPVSAHWVVSSTPLDFDFATGHFGLRELATLEVDFGDAVPENFFVFGEYDYSKGGGANPWLCVRKSDGWVCGFDLEREEAVFVFNSSIERFITTFGFLNRYLGNSVPALLPACCELEVSQIDPEAYPNSDWKHLIECVLND